MESWLVPLILCIVHAVLLTYILQCLVVFKLFVITCSILFIEPLCPNSPWKRIKYQYDEFIK